MIEGVEEGDLGQDIQYDEAEVKKILRKVDWRLLPLLSIIYLLSFLDRGNIGNARVAGLEKDLKLTPAQFNLCLTAFFFPYAAFEVPSNIVLKFLRPSIYIPILMIAWGTVMTLSGIVKGYSGLLAVRIFLGFTEAGLFPGATYILTNWYCRRELQGRMAFFYSAATLAGAFSGLLAYAIIKMDGVGGLAGWRWIFILEGIVTVVVACVLPFVLPDSPETARFLSEKDRRFLVQRLSRDSGSTGRVNTNEAFQWRYVWAAATDVKVYLTTFILWANPIAGYGLIFTLPTVIHELGYSASNAQLLTIPVYAFALICTVICAILADKYRARAPFVIGPYCVAALGYIALIALPHPKYPGATYGMLFPAIAGIYAPVCGSLTWNANNLAGSWKRAIGMAIQLTFANLSGGIGSNIYLERQAPRYQLGYGLSLGVTCLAILSAVILRFLCAKINKQRDEMDVDAIREKYSEAELMDMGDASPLFRYSL
ncbi:putative MFS nicotinic acid transporter Tna1 [Mytilinidion resinicola]|uniref:MFS nicotinic acid transporter Tna1 n=1 Tax=Mytilinidion resinicola TaxID=574789 RepID=A0A6A6Z2J0_9PEZI|nr:putative MFS nicotinic acid transporter Tna1 [Mytilinidion resinicola]KAF2814447.1 putative MFS nicotinic acid transporter Tna1 [Mytilinidion resinicola]